jgi:catalase
MSDRTIPRSLRMIEGFGPYIPHDQCARQGHVRQVPLATEARRSRPSGRGGQDRRYRPRLYRRDLFEAIAAGAFPEWELGIQVFDEAFAARQPYDVLDATKLIPEEQLPLQVIGRLVLDRNPDNFFAETEQVAYCPANIVPGVDFTNDPLRQGRLVSYLDTQLKRLGSTNFHQRRSTRRNVP